MRSRQIKIVAFGELKDGIKLIALVEQLTGKKVVGFNANPHMRLHKLNNIAIALKALKDEGVYFTTAPEGKMYLNFILNCKILLMEMLN